MCNMIRLLCPCYESVSCVVNSQEKPLPLVMYHDNIIFSVLSLNKGNAKHDVSPRLKFDLMTLTINKVPDAQVWSKSIEGC